MDSLHIVLVSYLLDLSILPKYLTKKGSAKLLEELGLDNGFAKKIKIKRDNGFACKY